MIKAKGLRLYDVSKLVGCHRSVLSRFVVKGDYENNLLTEQILALKEQLERNATGNQNGFYVQNGISSGIPYKSWGKDVLTKPFEALKVKLLDMIESRSSEEPLILMVEFYPGGST